MKIFPLLLAGFYCFWHPCATAQSPTTPIKVIVSPDIVSTLTETPGGDYHVPQSQLFIGGSRATSILGGGLLGLIVSSANNASSIGNSAPTSKLSFDTQVTQAIKSGIAPANIIELLLNHTSNDYNVKILPSARLLTEDDESATLSFRLTARLRLNNDEREITKNFFYGLTTRRPISGERSWLENDAAAIRNESKIAFERLLFALQEEINGKIKTAIQPGNQKILKIRSAKDKPVSSAVLISESPDTLVVVPMIGTNVLWAIIQVFDKKSIELVQ